MLLFIRSKLNPKGGKTMNNERENKVISFNTINIVLGQLAHLNY